jgi:hypothetical protein
MNNEPHKFQQFTGAIKRNLFKKGRQAISASHIEIAP